MLISFNIPAFDLSPSRGWMDRAAVQSAPIRKPSLQHPPVEVIRAMIRLSPVRLFTRWNVALLSFALWTVSASVWPGGLSGQEEPQSSDARSSQSDVQEEATDGTSAASPGDRAAVSGSSTAGSKGSSSGGSSSSAAATPKHAVVLKGAKPIDGVLRTYQSDTKLFAELSSQDYQSEYIVLISIARGIGQNPLLGGMSWGFGDDWVWSFRKIGDRVHIVRKNVRFRATRNSPEATAVKNAYTDSVLFSLPVLTKGPRGGDLIDLTPVFMSDLPQISQFLPGFMFSPTKSVWESVKGFKDNVEVEVAATYQSSGRADFDSVTINVHYSISKIPHTDYRPRLADDRVGYFLTVVKDYSKGREEDQFVRYINRWHLKKADPKADKSVPVRPIVFWIEKTVPYQYRKPIADGIAEWNKAFEQAGFVNAIEVRQQPADATWDPEDINYNTFRWITSSAGFAMGPSRVNPHTGQILDADIIFDADFIESWKSKFETLTPEMIASLTGGPIDLETYRQHAKQSLATMPLAYRSCVLSQGMTMELAFGRTALAAMPKGETTSDEEMERLVMQGLKEVTMHEVGHTLGLRHNFKSSTYMTLEEMNDVERTGKTGLSASVMDYLPVHIVPEGEKQGDYYSTTIGPYDKWAIEYGYKALSGETQRDKGELAKIAARSGEPGLAYATDENTRGIDPDPYSNRFDLSKNPLEYAQRQAKTVRQLMPKVADRLIEPGEDYSEARKAFNVLLATQGRAMFFAARFVGGLEMSRSHKGDADAPPPFQVIEADRQREALKLLEEHVFSDQPYEVDPQLYNLLAPSHWSHWGVSAPERTDFPVHQVVAMWQARILDKLLSSLTLERLHDSELRVAADEDALTVAELISDLTRMIFSELKDLSAGEYSNRKPAISSLRRNLQNDYIRRLGNLALGRSSAPSDCRALAYSQLAELAAKMDAARQTDGLDGYSRAHLRTSSDRIRKILEASVTVSAP